MSFQEDAEARDYQRELVKIEADITRGTYTPSEYRTNTPWRHDQALEEIVDRLESERDHANRRAQRLQLLIDKGKLDSPEATYDSDNYLGREWAFNQAIAIVKIRGYHGRGSI